MDTVFENINSLFDVVAWQHHDLISSFSDLFFDLLDLTKVSFQCLFSDGRRLFFLDFTNFLLRKSIDMSKYMLPKNVIIDVL